MAQDHGCVEPDAGKASRKTWVTPELRKITVPNAEDNAGGGSDSNGRLS